MFATVPYPEHLDTPRVLDAICRTNKKSEFVCRIALATQNGAIVQLQAGKHLCDPKLFHPKYKNIYIWL